MDNVILNNILDELKILTSGIKAKSLKNFYDDFLTTEQKIAIYEAIDGVQDSKGISIKANCSDRYVQVFLKDLVEKDLIDTTKQGNSIIPIKNANKIALYYANITANTIKVGD